MGANRPIDPDHLAENGVAMNRLVRGQGFEWAVMWRAVTHVGKKRFLGLNGFLHKLQCNIDHDIGAVAFIGCSGAIVMNESWIEVEIVGTGRPMREAMRPWVEFAQCDPKVVFFV